MIPFLESPSLAAAARRAVIGATLGAGLLAVAGCGGSTAKAADAGSNAAVTVGVAKVVRKPLDRQLTLSSELVPFEEIDVYAKESGFVKTLNVDYGSRVKAGDVLAVLEIPELEAQLRQDEAAVKSAGDRIEAAKHEQSRVEAQHKVAHLQYGRLADVAKTKAGLVAQQEVDDAEAKDLEAESAAASAESNLEASESVLDAAQATLQRDRALFSYARITAPFAGVVTQRFANLGTLLQAGTNSSTQAMPLVRLSEDSLFRLVIPVPESYVRYVRIGDPVSVRVAALDSTLPGKIARFSVDVKEDTRTMHTEVDVPNADRVLVPGMYAEATLTLDRKSAALAVPLQAINHEGDRTTVYTVDAAGHLEDRPVTLGMQTATDGEVLDGLKEGDLVVVGDRGGLKPGQAVHTQVVDVMRYSTDAK